jgi:hypothetical protein
VPRLKDRRRGQRSRGAHAPRRVKIFVSRAGADKDIAIWIARTLEAAGYDCVIQDRDFRLGAHFPQAMEDAFEGCQAMLAVLSGSYAKSPYCRDEWSVAYAFHRIGRARLIPVRVKAGKLPPLAEALAYLDLVGVKKGDKAQRLVAAVDGVMRHGRRLPDVLEPDLGPLTNASFDTAHFTGRDRELARLHEALWGVAGAAALTEPAAVHGLGGIGKSAIAREYTKRHLHRYCAAWFVRAEQSSTLFEDLAALAVRLNSELEREKDIVGRARRGAEEASRLAKQTHRPLLILLDNVDTPSSVPDWLKADGLHLVLTSRYSAWPKGVAAVEINELPSAAARRLLLDAANRKAGNGLDALLKALAGLPLALIQAGAYLRENPSESFALYEAALARRIADKPDDWPADQKLVAATYEPSIAKAEAVAPGAREMLLSTAFFEPDDIPFALLADDTEGEAARKTRDALLRYSIWRIQPLHDAGLFASVHRLLQTVLRATSDPKAFDIACRAAARRLAMVIKTNHGQRYLLPWLHTHLIRLARLTPTTAQSVDLASALLERGGDLVHREGYAEAEPLLRRALAIYEASCAPSHPQIHDHIWTILHLAHALSQTSRLKESEHLYQKVPALVIEDATSEADPVLVGTKLSNWAEMLYMYNRVNDAMPLKLRALELYEKHLGPDHWKTRVARLRFLGRP